MDIKSYHVNPATGNPALCRAEKGKCPFGQHVGCFPGDEANAFKQIEAIYGRVMSDFLFPRPIRKPRR